jgi:hypothetical protein
MFMESGVGSQCRCGPVRKLPFEHVVPQARDPLCIQYLQTRAFKWRCIVCFSTFNNGIVIRYQAREECYDTS